MLKIEELERYNLLKGSFTFKNCTWSLCRVKSKITWSIEQYVTPIKTWASDTHLQIFQKRESVDAKSLWGVVKVV